MPRVCTGCSHPDRKGLEAAIISGRPKAAIARDWGLKPDAVHGHAKHIAKKVAKAAEKEGRTQAKLLSRAHADLDWAIESGIADDDRGNVIKAVQARAKLAEVEFGSKSKVELSTSLTGLTDEDFERLKTETLAKLAKGK